jgi:hypothetical protein
MRGDIMLTTEQEAIKLAAWYSTPSEAISESRLEAEQ